MEPLSEHYVHELELQAASLRGENARTLKEKVEKALVEAGFDMPGFRVD